jgi:UDP-GlcNAc:undecaprenyl-phosphate GlcNAc-1-phosphate transferase
VRTIIIIFASALAFALVTTPIVRRVAAGLGFVDHPDIRKVHSVPVPLMGGVAIYIAVVISMMLFGRNYLIELAAILAGATVTGIIGLWDDHDPVHWMPKLAGQALVAAGLYLAGVQVQLPWLPDYVDFTLTVLWIVGVTNAVNLLDNMDGLSCGVSAVALAFMTVIGAFHGQYMVATLAAAMLGACLGFLLFNSRPASIFMGDAGALLVGQMLAVVAIKLRFPGNSSIVTWMVPVFVLAVPLFDMALVVVSRARRGLNPMATPGQDHTSHRLVDRGFSPREAVLTLYLAGCGCGLAAIYVMQASVLEAYLTAAAGVVLALWLIWKLDRRQGE